MSSTAFDVTKDSLLIRAGAGAGKTTTLIRTFIEFCEKFEEQHKKLPRVAITTFTRKATQEVKERLSIKAIEKGDQRLFQHINKKSSVHISTIHGLLTLFVQDNADLLGLPQNIRIIDQTLYKKNLKKAVRSTIKSKPEYIDILEHYSFVRVTELLMQALEAIKQKGDLRAVTPLELKELLKENLSTTNHYLEAILYHKNSIPDSWNEYFEFLVRLSQAAKRNEVESLLALVDEKPTKPRWNKKSPPFPQEAHELIEELWDQFDLAHYDSESFYQQHEKLNSLFIQLAQDVFHQDQQRKATTSEITINDLELLSLELVRNHPQAIEDFSDRFDYYMIDEFQDTSPIQVEILDSFIKRKPHFIVGDPQQSIYLFRGARSEVFYEKQKMAEQGDQGLQLRFLDTNYRSQPSLMLFINDYFKQMSSQFAPMKTNPLKDAARSDVSFIHCENEAEAVLQHIARLLKSGVSAKEICVLSRRNSNLMKISALAQKVKIPVQLQVSAGFDQKREILDLIGMLKFLVNPHDSENLILLLRSPWSHLSDRNIAAAVSHDREKSLWVNLNQKFADERAVLRLNEYFLNYQKVGVSEALIQLVKQSGFLDLTALYDNSGKREANFWKFFIHLKNAESTAGFTLGRYLSDNFQFLQSDLGSSQSEAIPVSQPDRVSLMTIHASKGLEFPHVIVVGFSEQPQMTLHLPLALDMQKGLFSLAPYILSESKSVSCRWTQKLRKDFNQKELDEHERLLYVAMTRAQTSLALIAEAKTRQVATSWQKKSLWPEAGTHEKEHYNLISLTATSDIDYQPPASLQVAGIKERLKFVKSAVESKSVTESLDIGIDEASLKVNYQSKIADFQKAKKGTDLHRLFESLQTYLNNKNLLSTLEKTLKADELKSVQFLLSQTDIPLKDLIQKGHVEWGFGIKTKKTVLQGQIDLWGIANGEIYLLDYKTGSSGYAQKAYQQLAFYAHCLYRMKMIDRDMKLNFAVTYPLEELTLKQSYTSYEDFRRQSDPVVLSLFDEI